jgi:CheY-like chemotaxis protein
MPTVVIADDSPTLRRIVTSVLSKEGFEVVSAEDGVSAVQQVFATMPDAVVLDVQMPRVSGYVAARLLKDDWQTADIPIILLTSLDRNWSLPSVRSSTPRRRRPAVAPRCVPTRWNSTTTT